MSDGVGAMQLHVTSGPYDDLLTYTQIPIYSWNFGPFKRYRNLAHDQYHIA